MSAVSKINWGKLASAVATKQQTQASLGSFRKQYEDLRRQLSVLEDQKITVDFQAYRKVLSNQKVVDQLEATQKKFKPVAYNLAAQEKLITAFETKAVEKAQAAAQQIESEVSSLKETLKNIETARPVEDLSIDDVTQAIPEIDQKVEEMLKKGQWSVPGYSDRVGNIGFF